MKNRSVDVLLVRMDRIGDLVLNLPVDQSPHLKDQKIHWFITKGLSFVVDQAVPVRSYSEYERAYRLKQLRKMIAEIKELKPKMAVVFYGPWWVGLALWLAGVPVRIGRRSQWHSFIFFNRGVRQKRSRGDLHESEYNFQLLEKGLRQQQDSDRRPYLQLQSKQAQGSLQKHKLTPGSYIVIHPGMGGSALNWPHENYEALIQHLLTKWDVVVTGTKTDEAYLAPLKRGLQDLKGLHWLDGQLSGSELIGVLQEARAVVAPSTGVVHLAASTGTPTIGLYSSIPVESAQRWGPRGPMAEAVESSATPEAPPEEIMKQISLEEVLSALDNLTAPKAGQEQ